ncbi:MAG TPA: hypothetical protein DCM05_10530 [Elusimicrobia bacterium]|nr:hypothetical protein [Elusimicrobiota bacterium]
MRFLAPFFLTLALAAPAGAEPPSAEAGELSMSESENPLSMSEAPPRLSIAPKGIPPEADAALLRGIDCVFRMEFDEADASYRKALALMGGHPYPYLGLVGSMMTRYIYGTEQSDQALLDKFYKLADEAGAAAQAWLKKNPQDSEAMAALGASYGIAARVMTQRRSWLKAYFYGRKALKYTQASLKADPDQNEAWLGLGMYDYYTDTYPRFIGVLAKIVLRGDRRRGIAELYKSVERARYTGTAAKLILVEIFTEDQFGLREPKAAARFMKEVRAKYPDSAMLHAAELVALYEEGHYPEALASADAYLRRVKAGDWPPLHAAQGHLMRGTVLWAKGRQDEALAEFKLGADVRYKDGPTRWAVFARIRAGQLLDLMGQREAALAEYRLAADAPDLWDLKPLAQAGLKKPRGETFPGRISPF